MIRAFTIVAFVAAFAVTAAPASAHRYEPPPSSVPLGEGLVGQMELVNQRKLGAGKDRGWVKALPKPPQSGASAFIGKYIDLDGRF